MEVIRTWLPLVLIVVTTVLAYRQCGSSPMTDTSAVIGYLILMGLCTLCSLIGGLIGVFAGHDPENAGSRGAYIGAVVGLASATFLLLTP
jgi:hypothetical protein